MSRRGEEAKPRWRDVPPEVRRAAGRILGSPVARAERVFGGYAPSATFRMRLANGERAFFKGVNASSNEYMRGALKREERVYAHLGGLIGPWAPRYHGALRERDWHALLLEDLGPAIVPPWTKAKTRAAFHSFAEFHQSTAGDALPRWLPRRRGWSRFTSGWSELLRDDLLDRVASLAGRRRSDARRWLNGAAGRLREAAETLLRAPKPYALLHFDTRSDNVRLHGARLRMFDWPAACVGPHELDVALFALDPALEGGPSCEESIAWYREAMPLRDGVLDAAVATAASLFARRAWQEPVPDLPRLRPLQRRALKVSLAWAAHRLELPEPAWLAGVPD